MDLMAECCGGGMGTMMWGMGLLGLLVLILLVLAAAALVKYLLSGRGGRATEACGNSARGTGAPCPPLKTRQCVRQLREC